MRARGWPAHAAGRVELEVTDPVTGVERVVLEVEGGAGRVTPGGAGQVRCGIDVLSSWYSSTLRAEDAARLGVLEGDAASISAMDGLDRGRRSLDAGLLLSGLLRDTTTTPMRDASTLPLRLARLRSQHLTDDTRLGADPSAIARAVCAIQAQDFDSARHQLRVRSIGLTATAVDQAFDHERSVVKTWLMRGTLHLCAADDVRWMLGVFGPAVNRLGARQWATMGLDESTLQRAVRVIRKTLANGPVTRRELRNELVRRGVFKEPVGQAMIYLLFQTATLGITCSRAADRTG